MVRVLAPLMLIVALAPFQCAHDPDPAKRREETPGEALYGLAQEFRAKGDPGAWRATLEFLVAHYPSSRFAVSAREDLGTAGQADGGP